MNRTGYAKIDRVIDQAREAGLDVEVERRMTESVLLGTQVSVAVSIRHPRIEKPANMLELIDQAERIHLFWVWFVGNGATPKLCIANRTGWLGNEQKLQARMVKYAIQTLGESLARQNKES